MTYLDDLRRNGCQPANPAAINARLTAVPLDSIPYSQSRRHPTLHFRTDCSGWWSYAAGAYLDGPGAWGGFSTETAATYGAIYPIPLAQVGPGDAIGRCGPGSAGNGGHIAPVISVTVAGRKFRVIDLGSDGPNDRVIDAVSAGYTGWRYAFLAGATPPVLGSIELAMTPVMSALSLSFGGPVRDAQTALNAWWQGTDLTVDGVFGPITDGRVRDFQRDKGLQEDGKIGPLTSAKLLPFLPGVPTSPPAPEPTPVLTETRVRELFLAMYTQLDNERAVETLRVIKATVEPLLDIVGSYFDDMVA